MPTNTNHQRQQHQRKKARKGIKSTRGVPEDYEECKSVRKSFLLTPTANRGLDALAQQRGISQNELLERICRGKIYLVDADS